MPRAIHEDTSVRRPGVTRKKFCGLQRKRSDAWSGNRARQKRCTATRPGASLRGNAPILHAVRRSTQFLGAHLGPYASVCTVASWKYEREDSDAAFQILLNRTWHGGHRGDSHSHADVRETFQPTCCVCDGPGGAPRTEVWAGRL